MYHSDLKYYCQWVGANGPRPSPPVSTPVIHICELWDYSELYKPRKLSPCTSECLTLLWLSMMTWHA